MGMITVIKRTFQGMGCLVIVVVMAGSALSTYVETNPEVQERMKLSVEDAEMRVDRDATVWEKLGAVVSSWWDSDELVAEAAQDKALSKDSQKKQEERERERRFNDSHYSENDDYYGSSS